MSNSIYRDPLLRTRKAINLELVKQGFFGSGVLFSVLSMAFGAPMVALFIVATIGLIATSYRELPTVLTQLNLVYVLPILFLVSTFWSIYPLQTLRAAIQFTVTITFATVGVAAIRPKRLIGIVSAAFIIVVAFSFFYINQVFEGRALRGPFGSKNILAHLSAMTFILCVSSLFLTNSKFLSKTIWLGGAVLSFTSILLAASAGAMVSSIIGVVAAMIALTMGALKGFTRAIILAFTTLTVAICAIMWKSIRFFLEKFIVEALGKDLTFTGRTDIWMIGHEVFLQKPVFGFGYYSFWSPDNPIAVRIWAMFNISNQTGFNFHNDFMEIAVGNGVIGVVVFAMVVLASWILLFAKVIHKDSHAFIFTGLYAYLFSKLFVETSVNYPFSANTMVFWLIVSSALIRRSAYPSLGPIQAGPRAGHRRSGDYLKQLGV